MLRGSMVNTEEDDALNALRALTKNPQAEFRDGQRESIDMLVKDRARVIVVQRTGWGKSAVYFVATHLLRKRGLGPTLIVSPLIALMNNQINSASALGLSAYTLNSSNDLLINEFTHFLSNDAVDLLLISPEQLAKPEFIEKVMPIIGRRPGLIVIDEVHCISDWGHDFRPDYRRLGQVVSRLPAGIPILGTTATANDKVIDDISLQLGKDIPVFRGPLRREGLALSVLDLPNRAERLAWLDKNQMLMWSLDILRVAGTRLLDTGPATTSVKKKSSKHSNGFLTTMSKRLLHPRHWEWDMTSPTSALLSITNQLIRLLVTTSK